MTDATPEIAESRHPRWPRLPHALSARSAARYLQGLRRDLVASFNHDPARFRLAPSRPGEMFAGDYTTPAYNPFTGEGRGMASGENLLSGGLRARVQDVYPQLTRLFLATHEAFHHADIQMNITLPLLARRYPALAERVRAIDLAALNRDPTPANVEAHRAFFRGLSREQRGFLMHARERFADAAAAVYLLNHIDHPQAPEFIEAWRSFRAARAPDDPGHASSDVVKGVVRAYEAARARGDVRPGSMTMRGAASFVASVTRDTLGPPGPSPGPPAGAVLSPK